MTFLLNARQLGVNKMIADTGSGLHLLSMEIIDRNKVRKYLKELKAPICFDTAGGQTTCKYELELHVPSLSQFQITAHILDDTPSVLSIGRFCIDNGFSFHWPANSETPYFETPWGSIIELAVEDYIPYLGTRSSAAGDDAKTAAPNIQAAQELKDMSRWHTVTLDSQDTFSAFGVYGCPPKERVRRICAYDLHTRQPLYHVDGVHLVELKKLKGPLPQGMKGDTITYVYSVPEGTSNPNAMTPGQEDM
jgi:hypothetical protein